MTVGSLITDIQGTTLTPFEQDYLCHPLVGGIILFSRNFKEIEQLLALTAVLRVLPRMHPLLITVDQEGGRVQRFLNGFTKIPPMRALGMLYDKDPSGALILGEQCGFVIASELMAVGVDLSFAPVLDLASSQSQVIGDRAFHSDPYKVTRLASAFIKGMSAAGMSSVGKHFPGHGSVTADSHTEMVQDKRIKNEIFDQDLMPFIKLARDLSGVMAAHVMYPNLDERPAGFSPYWLRTVLREHLGFRGAVFSDDLHMQGASLWSRPIEGAIMALTAGCDMILSCNHPTKTLEILNQLNAIGLKPPVEKIATLYATKKITRRELFDLKSWQIANAAICQFNERENL